MDWQLGGYVVVASRVLAEVLLELELSLQKLLALLVCHHFAILLILQQLHVKDTNK